MKKLLLVIFFTAMGMFKGHSQALVQTYVDRCTGAVNVFSVPMNGSTVVAFYNRSRVFTSQDFQNGTLQAWLEETYLWWTALSPCSTTTTGAQATQQTTQQTTQQATQAATNAAAQAASTPTPAVPATPAPTTPTTNAPPTTTSPPPTTEAPQTTSPDTSTANPATNTENQSSGGTDNTSTGTDNSTSGTNQESTTETQSSSEQTDTSSTETTESSNESTETASSEETSTDDSSTETSNEDSSTEETSTESEDVEETSTEESTEESTESETEETTEESTEEEKKEETKEEEKKEEEKSEEKEETDEESSEEESDESSEEESEEETEEEESESDEDEDSDEEESEEESSNEDEEEEDEDDKKKRNLAPPIVTANAMSQQLPTGEFQQAVTFGISQSSLMGDKTYGLNAMVYDNLNQFMLTANYSKVHINKEGRVSRVYSASIGAMKMFTTFMGMMNHSMTFLGKKGSVAGIALGTSLTTNNVDVVDGLLYFDNQFLGVSLTGFYTKSFQLTDKIGISPMLAVSSPFMMFDMYKHTTMWNSDLMMIAGTGVTYKLTQRFGLNIGANIIESTAAEFPTMKTFTIGGRLSF